MTSEPPPPDYSDRWESQWQAGGTVLQPGQAFDAAGASPVLRGLLSSGELAVAGKSVFVPGCGRGYDLVAFAQAGAASVVGLELAPTAAEQANEYVGSQLGAGSAAAVVQGDFFKFEAPGAGFDAGYDYTFLW